MRLARPALVGLGVGLLCALGATVGVFDSWSLRAIDRLFLPRAPDPAIVIIAIDDASITQVGRWPWPRRVHAELIQKLSDANVRAIGFDVNFPEVSDTANDDALVEALRASGRVVLPVELKLQTVDDAVRYDATQVLAPLEAMRLAAAGLGHSNTPPDIDGTVRRVPLEVRSHEGTFPIRSFAAEVARIAGIETNITDVLGGAGTSLVVHYAGEPFRTYPTIPAIDVLTGRADLAQLRNAVVFVGSTAPDLHDALLVPTSYGVLMPGVEIHASIYETISSKQWLRPLPAWALALAIVVIGILIGLLAASLRARWTVPILVCAWASILIAAFVAFERGVMVDLVWPSFALFFAFGAVTLERRVQSDRDKRELKTAFSRYVSSSVVDSILKDPTKLKLGGERKRMSVLFSDIRGFTTISEGLPPEKLVEMLNTYLSRMTEIVFEQNGVLDKYIGDAVMAFWNAPLAEPRHALRAVTAAIEMRDALAEMNRQKAFGEVDLHIGLGVNTGDMVVGNVGGAARFDYTVIGDNVNLGSRLEGLTKEYGIDMIVAASTAQEIGSEILCRKLDKVAVKGKKEPVTIYHVLGRQSTATPADFELVRAFETALDAYFAKDFAGAIAKCDAILATMPTDGPSKTLRERAQHFLTTPPPADWIGTWVYTKK